jgi:hypothetical protein
MFEKGKSGNPRGRPPGSQSKSTVAAREAIARLVDGNVERMQEWLDQIAEQEGPMAAWRCLNDVIEYHIPKLARTELVGDGGGPLRVVASSKDEEL